MSPGVSLGALSLGQAIDQLGSMPPGAPIVVRKGRRRLRPGELRSYRGYYEDLALGYSDGAPRRVCEALDHLKWAIGIEFEGYKGGHYRAHRGTGLWIALSASDVSGWAIVDMRQNGGLVELAAERVDD